MKYKVYHAINPDFGHVVKGKEKKFPNDFKHVATVDCENLEHVFQVTNHIDHSWTENSEVVCLYNKNPRSTSVGDIITGEFGGCWRCEMAGWKDMYAAENDTCNDSDGSLSMMG